MFTFFSILKIGWHLSWEGLILFHHRKGHFLPTHGGVTSCYMFCLVFWFEQT